MTSIPSLELFARRALGFARNDDSLITQAIERFTAIGMDSYATETSTLLAPWLVEVTGPD